MSLAAVLDLCVDVAEWFSDACLADDALALSLTSTAWLEVLSRPAVWHRYLYGSQKALARPILNDPVVASLFSMVHESKYRAVVAALRMPGWLRRYPAMKQRLAAGAMLTPVRNWSLQPQARQAKRKILKAVRSDEDMRKVRSKEKASERERRICMAFNAVKSDRCASPPSTPKRREESGPPLLCMTSPEKSSPVRRLTHCALNAVPVSEHAAKRNASHGLLESSSTSSSSSTSTSSSSSASLLTPRKRQHPQSSSTSSSSSSSSKAKLPRQRRTLKPVSHPVVKAMCQDG